MCVGCVCVHRCIGAGPTFRLMACGTCFSFNAEQNPVISNIITNWPSFSSWVTETRWTRAVQCLPAEMLQGFVVKKHRGLVTALFPPHTACVEPRQGFSWHHLMPQWPGDLPNPGIEPRSPALQEDSLPAEPPGKPRKYQTKIIISPLKKCNAHLFTKFRTSKNYGNGKLFFHTCFTVQSIKT